MRARAKTGGGANDRTRRRRPARRGGKWTSDPVAHRNAEARVAPRSTGRARPGA